MKRVAVGLFGVHYVEILNHWMGWKTNVDYKKTLLNNHNMLFDRFDCTFYSSTYFSEKINELILDYDFKKLKLSKINNEFLGVHESNSRRNTIFIDTLKLILEDYVHYEYVLLTRYDLNFFDSPFDFNVNYNKINVICKSKSGNISNLIDDNFYFMPMDTFYYFYDSISKLPLMNTSHEYNKVLDGINYIIDGDYYSHEIPIYNIVR